MFSWGVHSYKDNVYTVHSLKTRFLNLVRYNNNNIRFSGKNNFNQFNYI